MVILDRASLEGKKQISKQTGKSLLLPASLPLVSPQQGPVESRYKGEIESVDYWPQDPKSGSSKVVWGWVTGFIIYSDPHKYNFNGLEESHIAMGWEAEVKTVNEDHFSKKFAVKERKKRIKW